MSDSPMSGNGGPAPSKKALENVLLAHSQAALRRAELEKELIQHCPPPTSLDFDAVPDPGRNRRFDVAMLLTISSVALQMRAQRERLQNSLSDDRKLVDSMDPDNYSKTLAGMIAATKRRIKTLQQEGDSEGSDTEDEGLGGVELTESEKEACASWIADAPWSLASDDVLEEDKAPPPRQPSPKPQPSPPPSPAVPPAAPPQQQSQPRPPSAEAAEAAPSPPSDSVSLQQEEPKPPATSAAPSISTSMPPPAAQTATTPPSVAATTASASTAATEAPPAPVTAAPAPAPAPAPATDNTASEPINSAATSQDTPMSETPTPVHDASKPSDGAVEKEAAVETPQKGPSPPAEEPIPRASAAGATPSGIPTPIPASTATEGSSSEPAAPIQSEVTATSEPQAPTVSKPTEAAAIATASATTTASVTSDTSSTAAREAVQSESVPSLPPPSSTSPSSAATEPSTQGTQTTTTSPATPSSASPPAAQPASSLGDASASLPPPPPPPLPPRLIVKPLPLAIQTFNDKQKAATEAEAAAARSSTKSTATNSAPEMTEPSAAEGTRPSLRADVEGSPTRKKKPGKSGTKLKLHYVAKLEHASDQELTASKVEWPLDLKAALSSAEGQGVVDMPCDSLEGDFGRVETTISAREGKGEESSAGDEAMEGSSKASGSDDKVWAHQRLVQRAVCLRFLEKVGHRLTGSEAPAPPPSSVVEYGFVDSHVDRFVDGYVTRFLEQATQEEAAAARGDNGQNAAGSEDNGSDAAGQGQRPGSSAKRSIDFLEQSSKFQGESLDDSDAKRQKLENAPATGDASLSDSALSILDEPLTSLLDQKDPTQGPASTKPVTEEEALKQPRLLPANMAGICYDTPQVALPGQLGLPESKEPSKHLVVRPYTVYTPQRYLKQHGVRERWKRIRSTMTWLTSRWEAGLNGILRAEPSQELALGVGAFFNYLLESRGLWGRHLLIVPASYARLWQAALAWGCPSLHVTPYWGASKDRLTIRRYMAMLTRPDESSACHVVLTTHTVVKADIKFFNDVHFQSLFLQTPMPIAPTYLVPSSIMASWSSILTINTKIRVLISAPVAGSMWDLAPEYLEYARWHWKQAQRYRSKIQSTRDHLAETEGKTPQEVLEEESTGNSSQETNEEGSQDDKGGVSLPTSLIDQRYAAALLGEAKLDDATTVHISPNIPTAALKKALAKAKAAGREASAAPLLSIASMDIIRIQLSNKKDIHVSGLSAGTRLLGDLGANAVGSLGMALPPWEILTWLFPNFLDALGDFVVGNTMAAVQVEALAIIANDVRLPRRLLPPFCQRVLHLVKDFTFHVPNEGPLPTPCPLYTWHPPTAALQLRLDSTSVFNKTARSLVPYMKDANWGPGKGMWGSTAAPSGLAVVRGAKALPLPPVKKAGAKESETPTEGAAEARPERTGLSKTMRQSWVRGATASGLCVQSVAPTGAPQVTPARRQAPVPSFDTLREPSTGMLAVLLDEKPKSKHKMRIKLIRGSLTSVPVVGLGEQVQVNQQLLDEHRKRAKRRRAAYEGAMNRYSKVKEEEPKPARVRASTRGRGRGRGKSMKVKKPSPAAPASTRGRGRGRGRGKGRVRSSLDRAATPAASPASIAPTPTAAKTAAVEPAKAALLGADPEFEVSPEDLGILPPKSQRSGFDALAALTERPGEAARGLAEDQCISIGKRGGLVRRKLDSKEFLSHPQYGNEVLQNAAHWAGQLVARLGQLIERWDRGHSFGFDDATQPSVPADLEISVESTGIVSAAVVASALRAWQDNKATVPYLTVDSLWRAVELEKDRVRRRLEAAEEKIPFEVLLGLEEAKEGSNKPPVQPLPVSDTLLAAGMELGVLQWQGYSPASSVAPRSAVPVKTESNQLSGETERDQSPAAPSSAQAETGTAPWLRPLPIGDRVKEARAVWAKEPTPAPAPQQLSWPPAEKEFASVMGQSELPSDAHLLLPQLSTAGTTGGGPTWNKRIIRWVNSWSEEMGSRLRERLCSEGAAAAKADSGAAEEGEGDDASSSLAARRAFGLMKWKTEAVEGSNVLLLSVGNVEKEGLGLPGWQQNRVPKAADHSNTASRPNLFQLRAPLLPVAEDSALAFPRIMAELRGTAPRGSPCVISKKVQEALRLNCADSLDVAAIRLGTSPAIKKAVKEGGWSRIAVEGKRPVYPRLDAADVAYGKLIGSGGLVHVMRSPHIILGRVPSRIRRVCRALGKPIAPGDGHGLIDCHVSASHLVSRMHAVLQWHQGARVWTLRVLSDTKPVLVDGLPLTKEAGPVALRPLAMITIGPVVLNLLLPRAFADHVRNMQRYKRGKNAIAPFLGAFPSTQHLHEALAYLNTSRETSKDTCETRWAQLTKAVAATVRGWRSHVSEEDVIEDDDDFEPSTARENTPAAEEEGDEPMDAPPKRLAAPSKPLYVRKSQASPMDVW